MRGVLLEQVKYFRALARVDKSKSPFTYRAILSILKHLKVEQNRIPYCFKT